jgi:protein-tyrosine-phosphatase
MKVLVVCRYNQARSILAGALIRKLLPELDVVTAGIQAQTGQPIPIVTAELCSWWGLNRFDRLSQSITDTDAATSIEEFDSVLVADGYVKQEVLKFWPKAKLVDLSELAENDLFTPTDPTGFNQSDFSRELAKIAVLSSAWASKSGLLDIISAQAILASSNSSIDSLLDSGKLNDVDFLIDTELERPSIDFWKSKGFEIQLFNPRQLIEFEVAGGSSSSTTVLASRFEIDNAEKYYLSDDWKQFIGKVSKVGKTCLVNISNTNDFKPSSLAILSSIHCGSRRWI